MEVVGREERKDAVKTSQDPVGKKLGHQGTQLLKDRAGDFSKQNAAAKVLQSRFRKSIVLKQHKTKMQKNDETGMLQSLDLARSPSELLEAQRLERLQREEARVCALRSEEEHQMDASLKAVELKFEKMEDAALMIQNWFRTLRRITHLRRKTRYDAEDSEEHTQQKIQEDRALIKSALTFQRIFRHGSSF